MNFKLVILHLFVVNIALSCLTHNQENGIAQSEAESKNEIVEESDSVFSLEEDFSSQKESRGRVEIELPHERQMGSVDREYVTYNAYPGETLMKIAYELYSDYSKWRKIAKANRALFENNYDILEQVTLKIPRPLNISKASDGHPYLIKPGDSLSLISRKVYGQMKFWPEIWDNNKTMIKDPDLIFAGFTLHYNERDYIFSLQDQYGF